MSCETLVSSKSEASFLGRSVLVLEMTISLLFPGLPDFGACSAGYGVSSWTFDDAAAMGSVGHWEAGWRRGPVKLPTRYLLRVLKIVELFRDCAMGISLVIAFDLKEFCTMSNAQDLSIESYIWRA
jgi:hypothetical protein